MTSKNSWLDLMLYSQDQLAIRNLEDEMQSGVLRQADTNIDNHFFFQKLLSLDQAQATEIRELRSCVKVLMDMLVASGTLDREDFGFRMEAELDRLRGEAEALAQERNLVVCDRCKKKVPREQTNIGGNGTFCDSCFNQNA